jgi:hypothetical protein
MEEAIALPHRNSNLPRTTNNYKAVLEFHRRLGQLMSLQGALAALTRSSDVHSPALVRYQSGVARHRSDGDNVLHLGPAYAARPRELAKAVSEHLAW